MGLVDDCCFGSLGSLDGVFIVFFGVVEVWGWWSVVGMCFFGVDFFGR